MPSVAVLLATYNGANYLSAQTASIASQDLPGIHVYARDDGSNDASEAIIKSCLNDSFFLVPSAASTGSPAGNFFKLLSSIDLDIYDYVAFADQDDVWFPDKLRVAINLIISTKSDCYSSDLIAFDHSNFHSWYIKKSASLRSFDYLFQGASAGCTYVISKKAAKLVLASLGDFAANFPKGYSHDWLIYAICRSNGLKWVHDSRAFIAYRQHSSNAFGGRPGVMGILSRLNLSRTGWYRKQIIWNYQFLTQTPAEEKIVSSVAKFQMSDKIFLLANINSYRRTVKDRILLAAAILVGFL